MIERLIPSTKESLSVIGLGTWQAFDVSSQQESDVLSNVINGMHKAGGKLIDSSPMYGRAEEVVGVISEAASIQNDFFYATKVWTQGREGGIRQMNDSLRKLRRSFIDLMQIHNLVDWKTHMATLRQWKEEGKVRYIGITHYMDSMHEDLEKIIRSEPVDFVQFNYSITSRNAEKRLLPAAADHGVATLVNRPFGEGSLFARVKGKNLPAWTKDQDIDNWASFFLKFIISHPAVTCVIPGTGNPDHVVDNMKAGQGSLPDDAIRERMAAFVKNL